MIEKIGLIQNIKPPTEERLLFKTVFRIKTQELFKFHLIKL